MRSRVLSTLILVSFGTLFFGLGFILRQKWSVLALSHSHLYSIFTSNFIWDGPGNFTYFLLISVLLILLISAFPDFFKRKKQLYFFFVLFIGIPLCASFLSSAIQFPRYGVFNLPGGTIIAVAYGQSEVVISLLGVVMGLALALLITNTGQVKRVIKLQLDRSIVASGFLISAVTLPFSLSEIPFIGVSPLHIGAFLISVPVAFVVGVSWGSSQ